MSLLAAPVKRSKLVSDLGGARGYLAAQKGIGQSSGKVEAARGERGVMRLHCIFVQNKQEKVVATESKSGFIALAAQPGEVWGSESAAKAGLEQRFCPTLRVQYTKVALVCGRCSVVLSKAFKVKKERASLFRWCLAPRKRHLIPKNLL